MVDFTAPLMSEKRFYTIPDEAFTADSTVKGLITVSSTYPYKVGMVLGISSTTVPTARYKIKRIISETQMYVGDDDNKILVYADVSQYTVADGAKISYKEDKRPVIDLNEINRQVYAEEPTIAIRTYPVDVLGRGFNQENPFPVTEAKNSKDYDRIIIARDLDKDITKVTYQKDGAELRVFDLYYDVDKDLIQVDKQSNEQN
jgi:hypothetical protein